jgi:asparagine synthase (glutamine-hydrolysing)
VRITEAAQLLEHRGPDDKGEMLDNDAGVCLAHTRLAILDCSAHGHQPMKHSDGQIIIVFNGEIYNYLSLRSELEENGYEFCSAPDTEVLLALYKRDKHSMLASLNGIFAFAIWDECEHKLFIARDGFGVKPLYYCETNNGFKFSSELKALVPLVGHKLTPDCGGIGRYLAYLWSPGRNTPVNEMRKLGPGEAMVVTPSGIESLWKWYKLPVARNTKRGDSGQTSKSAIEGTRKYLEAAVSRQLVSDVPVGAFLSGGLDSSAVVAIARQELTDLRCFTIEAADGPERGTTDDLNYARRVADHLGVKLDVVTTDSSSMAAEVERMVYQLDEPLADPAALNVRYISRLARQNNRKVLLSGAGGDDIFTGYRRHVAVNYEK